MTPEQQFEMHMRWLRSRRGDSVHIRPTAHRVAQILDKDTLRGSDLLTRRRCASTIKESPHQRLMEPELVRVSLKANRGSETSLQSRTSSQRALRPS